MYFEALKIFCDVVRFRSFSKGAAANGVSQSAASQAVLQIEKRLGAQLVDRSKRPWVLTAEGKTFFEGCQDIVSRYLELEEAVRRRKQETGYKVRVAAIYSVSFQDIGRYAEEFKAAVPGSDVDIEYMHPDRVYESVLSDQADLGLLAFAQNGQDLVSLPWREETMVFTCLPSHRLARVRSARPVDLNGERIVNFDKGLPIRRELDRFLRKHHVEVEIAAEFDNVASVKQAVEDGVGVAILPEPTLRREVERHALATVPFAGTRLMRPLSIIHRRRRKLNSIVLGFIDLLRAARNGASRNEASRNDASRNAESKNGAGHAVEPDPAARRKARKVARVGK